MCGEYWRRIEAKFDVGKVMLTPRDEKSMMRFCILGQNAYNC